MSDDTARRGVQDRSRIAMQEEHEVPYRTQTLGVTREELAEAVREVGNSTDEVREFVRRRAH